MRKISGKTGEAVIYVAVLAGLFLFALLCGFATGVAIKHL